MSKKLNVFLFWLFVYSILQPFASAEVTNWTGTVDNDWFKADNWDAGVPSLTKDAIVDTAGPIISGGGATAQVWKIGDAGTATLTIQSDANLSTSKWGGVGIGSGGVGTLNVYGDLIVNSGDGPLNVGNYGDGTLNMYSGTIQTNSLTIAKQSGSDGQLNLYGGTIYITVYGVTVGSKCGGATGHAGMMDIYDGALIMDGDYTSQINQFVLDGWMVGYGGTGTVNFDNITNPGKTTVTASTVSAAYYASYPEPFDKETDVNPLLDQFSWSAGCCTDYHDVYFGINFDDVNTATDPNVLPGRGRQDSNSYPETGALALEFGRTYYWRVDQVNEILGVWKGDIWQFTVADHLMAEDFESYADSNDLLTNWADGNSNFSGAAISLDAELDKFMKLTYDNNNSPFYSETARSYTSDQNWAVSNVVALSMQYKGDPNVDGIYVGLCDAVGANDIYVFSDANLIRSVFWSELNIDLTEFNGLDLTRIRKISLGVANEIPTPGGQGVVYFDDIRLYPSRCFPAYGPIVDLTNDCLVDFNDLEAMARKWLASGYNVTASEPNNLHLQVHYKFDETDGNDTAFDSSANFRHGTVNANDINNVWDPCGHENGCLAFDGNTVNVSVPNEVFSNINTEITISVWLKIDANNNSHDSNQIGFSTGPLPPDYNQWDQVAWNSEDGNTLDGNWEHYAFVKDVNQGIMRIYQNALLVAESTGAFYIMAGSDPGQTVIGANGGGATCYFKGKLDDFRIYNYALPQAEILYLAQGSGGELYQPLQPILSAFDPHEDDKINLRDYAILADMWLIEQLWP